MKLLVICSQIQNLGADDAPGSQSSHTGIFFISTIFLVVCVYPYKDPSYQKHRYVYFKKERLKWFDVVRDGYSRSEYSWKCLEGHSDLPRDPELAACGVDRWSKALTVRELFSFDPFGEGLRSTPKSFSRSTKCKIHKIW